MAGGAGAGDLRPDVGAEGTDFGSNGGHIACRETFGEVVSLPILRERADRRLSCV
jgi:hypothetical protein